MKQYLLWGFFVISILLFVYFSKPTPIFQNFFKNSPIFSGVFNTSEKTSISKENWNSLYSQRCGISLQYPPEWGAQILEPDGVDWCDIGIQKPSDMKHISFSIKGDTKDSIHNIESAKSQGTKMLINNIEGYFVRSESKDGIMESISFETSDKVFQLWYLNQAEEDIQVFKQIYETIRVNDVRDTSSFVDNPIQFD